MERLTERTGEGQAIPRMDLKNNGHQRCMERLAEYEDLEEQGKLLKLPCAAGDRIYRIDTDEKIENREIEIYDIDNIVICSDGEILLKYDAYDGVICHLENITTDKPYLDYYRCFLAKEAAEAALKELRRGKEERAGKDLDSG